MDIIPFKAEHLFQIDIQESQQGLFQYVEEGLAQSLEKEMSFSAIHDGKVLGCAGIIRMWAGRGVMWSYLGSNIGPHLFKVTKAAHKLLDAVDYARIEATVDEGFEQGHRWIKMLGFELETPEPMKKYNPQGSSAYLYARIR